MSKKLICCSFEKGIPYVLITLNNGVHPDRPGHISGTFKIDKETYNKACKNRVMFNDIFDNVIDIRMGWQNALADAISNAQNLNTDDVDVGRLLKAAGEADVKLRGEEAVNRDLDELEAINDKIDAELEKEAKKKLKKTTKKVKKDDTKNDSDRRAGSEDSSKVAGSENGDGLPANDTGANDIAQGNRASL